MASFPYNGNIPQPTDGQNVSQGQMLINFVSIQSLIDVNHVDFANVNAGKHAFVEMPTQSPVPVTIANEVGMYVQASTFTSQPEIVISKQAGSTAPLQTYEITSAGYSNPGWSRLPSGILLKWGTFSGVAGSNTVTFPTGATIPAFTRIYTVNPTPQYAGTYFNVGLNTLTVTNFIVFLSANGPIQYLAIGI